MLTAPLTGLKILWFPQTFPWLARHGLNDHATPWLNTLRGPAPLIKPRETGFRVPRTAILTPMPVGILPRCACEKRAKEGLPKAYFEEALGSLSGDSKKILVDFSTLKE